MSDFSTEQISSPRSVNHKKRATSILSPVTSQQQSSIKLAHSTVPVEPGYVGKLVGRFNSLNDENSQQICSQISVHTTTTFKRTPVAKRSFAKAVPSKYQRSTVDQSKQQTSIEIDPITSIKSSQEQSIVANSPQLISTFESTMSDSDSSSSSDNMIGIEETPTIIELPYNLEVLLEQEKQATPKSTTDSPKRHTPSKSTSSPSLAKVSPKPSETMIASPRTPLNRLKPQRLWPEDSPLQPQSASTLRRVDSPMRQAMLSRKVDSPRKMSLASPTKQTTINSPSSPARHSIAGSPSFIGQKRSSPTEELNTKRQCPESRQYTFSPLRAVFSEGEDQERPEEAAVVDKRHRAVLELLTTEVTYVRNLRSMIDVYYRGLKEAGILDEQALDSIIGNTEDILNFNRQLLVRLKDRVKNWEENDTIGDLFLEMMPLCLTHYIKYCKNYNRAQRIVTRFLQEVPEFKPFILNVVKEGKASSLEDNLILPVQRLPRYQLLLQVIRKNTPEDHIDYRPVESAIRQIVHMNNAIDLKLKQIESRHILKTIESWCADTKTPLYLMNDRRLVYKVSTTTGEAKSFTFSDLPEESQTYTFFLMSDMLLIFDEVDLRSHKQTRKPQLYANIPIHQLFFFEIENKEHQLGFRMQLASPTYSFVFTFLTRAERNSWKNEFNKVIEEYLKNNSTQRIARMKIISSQEDDGTWLVVEDTLRFCVDRISIEDYSKTDVTALELAKLQNDPRFIELQNSRARSQSKKSKIVESVTQSLSKASPRKLISPMTKRTRTVEPTTPTSISKTVSDQSRTTSSPFSLSPKSPAVDYSRPRNIGDYTPRPKVQSVVNSQGPVRSATVSDFSTITDDSTPSTPNRKKSKKIIK